MKKGLVLGIIVALGCGGEDPETGLTNATSASMSGSASGSTGMATPPTGGETEVDSMSESADSTGADEESGSSGGSSGGTDGGSTTDDEGTSTGAATSGSTGAASDACKKVDVVISVDNSGSMQGEITALNSQGVFDQLAHELVTSVGDGIDDFHLAVVDACPKPATYHNFGDPGDCNFAAADNFMVGTNALEDDPGCAEAECITLQSEYNCVTQLTADGFEGQPSQCIDSGGFGDDDEQPAFTAAHSLSDVANAGFLRDDAVLLVVAITDEDEEMIGLEDDNNATIVPDDIAQMIVDAKGGHIENVVFLGIGGPEGGCTDGPYGSGQDAAQLRAVTSVFEDNVPQRGLFWNICDDQGLLAAFQEALVILDSACEDIILPG